MADLLPPQYWYTGSTLWAAVPHRDPLTAYTVGDLVKVHPVYITAGQERIFVASSTGTSSSSSSGSMDINQGARTIDNTVVWFECTGQPSMNGDAANTQSWNAAQNNTVSLGRIIKNTSSTHYFVATTAGTAGSSEPSWNTTAGVTTSDGSVTWTCLGAVGNFSAWGAPHALLPNALRTNWGSKAGDKHFVSDNHAETSSGWGPFIPGTGTAQSYIICVDDSSAPPTAMATTASITSTQGLSFSSNGYCYLYGLNFTAQTSINNQCDAMVFESCNFTLTGSNTISLTSENATAQKAIYKECNFVFANANSYLTTNNGDVEIIGGSIAATGTVPDYVFFFPNVNVCDILVRDCDLSAIDTNLVYMPGPSHNDIIFAYCKLGSGVTIGDGDAYGPNTRNIRLHNCDSAATNYRMHTQSFMGISRQDTGVYCDDGASDGTTPISWKIESTAYSNYWQPFVCEQIFQWVEDIGSPLTATVEVAGGTSLTDGDIWMEIEYMGDTASPLGFRSDNRKSDVLASATTLSSSAASWTGSPAVTQKLEVTFTPEMKGPIKARVYVAKPSATIYVDPLIRLA
jgi:hypothetical protein